MRSTHKKVTVILPCFNVKEYIGPSITRLKHTLEQLGVEHEVIVVDDGSLDDTRRVAEKFVADSESKVRVLGYPLNRGKGYALRYGFSYATGDVIIFFDSDLDIDTSRIKSYIDALTAYDIAIGSKVHPRSHVNAPIIRKLLSRAFNIMVRLAVKLRVSDTQVGLKAFDAEALRRIFPALAVKQHAFDVELLAVASLAGLRVTELPVTVRLNRIFSLKKIFRMAIDVMGIAYRLRIKKWYQHNLARVMNGTDLK